MDPLAKTVSQMSQSLEADLDVSLVELHQLQKVVLLQLVVVHQPESAVPEDDLELASSILLLEKLHLGYVFGWLVLLLLVLVWLDFDGGRIVLLPLPAAVSVLGLPLPFVGNDEVDVLNHIVVVQPLSLASLLQVVHDLAAYR